MQHLDLDFIISPANSVDRFTLYTVAQPWVLDTVDASEEILLGLFGDQADDQLHFRKLQAERWLANPDRRLERALALS